MTALIFVLEENQVLIAMDSLAIDAESNKPYKFTSKIFYIPHLHGAMCGTGDFEVVLEWHSFILKNVTAHSIKYLDSIAPKFLRDVHAGLKRNTTATIYHFGFNEEEQIFEGFVYRSTSRLLKKSC